MKNKIILAIFGVVIVIAALDSCSDSEAIAEGTVLPDSVSYNFNIRPIFSDKCFKCHGPDAAKREAHLRLDIADSAYAALKETKGAYAIVPGNVDASELFKRVSSTDTSYMMPPPNAHLGTLTPFEVQLIKKWIAQGAKYQKHWAFTSPVKAPLPKISDDKWPVNAIDYFVMQKLDQLNTAPNEAEDKERLLKRVSFDITGLPPSIAMMDKFLADNSDKAYEKVVDQLLQTPQYGEKMALHWLDIARYADSYGYQDDNIRSQWPWRDWVIHAFNKNLPFDQFLTWQIAGDMLPNATQEEMLATGFFRNHKYTEEGGVIPEEYRVEYLVDKTKTFTKGILGVTMECAQCHDHKYDPFSQKDYYQMLAFFNNTKEAGYEGDVSTSKPAKTPFLVLGDTDIQKTLSFIHKKDTGMLTISVMGELDTLRKTYILNRGRYDAPTVEVNAAAPESIMPFDTTKFPRNRLGLARWTVDKSNPLTARVFVNQIWQDIFGRGIVKTTGDYGMQGELPTHPELLDWLAVDFMEHNWDVKYLLKEILLSATYRQSTIATKEKLEKDPENKFYTRGPRTRLTAEFIRDMVLASSGLLVPVIGGPSVKPYQPAGLWESATSGRGVLATYKQDHGEDLYRRGMYTFIKLTVPPPSMVMFDASNRDQCEVKRSKTNTPLQALIMMNDPLVLEASRVLAQKLLVQNADQKLQISNAFRLIVCRKPTDKEMTILGDYYNQQLQQFQQKNLDANKTIQVGEWPVNDKADINHSAALMKVIVMIYNMEESIMKT
ncbi:PSD1 and planctomycete cytochrome C domain-containing protein [Limnovirga soli]|uniref:DUF1553 domain-containing protein n=1 Tax=Limnovirga soli TaxID=2656915 RepID=A0A8J8FBP9_9BACT|nr:PSD1 and planctomycete cytochrome C domain-containing protein [Limnovirga soli]NNV54612.1 DUF1553 domain-containing protein [Limnovirga soli]